MSLQSRAAPVTAASVGNYTPGNASPTYQTPSATLGNLNGDTGLGLGGLTPFNPAFQPSDIAIVGDGGSLTLQLSQEVPTNGINLGVFSNVGFASTSDTGQTDAAADTIGQVSRAVVSVSQDGVNFVKLNGGQPITFGNPTNYYTDTEISNNIQPIGTAHASQFKPFLGGSSMGSTTPNAFVSQSYDQIKTTLNNSAGGTWLDLRNTGMYSVNYVKFDVAAGSGDRMVVDAIGGLGATNTLSGSSHVISEDVGAGSNASHVVVDFGPQSYEFVVHYNGSITGEQALTMLSQSTDLKFGVEHFSFGDFLTSLDYGGYVQSGDGTLPGGGFGNNFWSYYTGDGTTWSDSGQGFSTRTLTNGSFDGWVWTDAQSTPPDAAVLPEPSSVALVFVGGMLLTRRRRK